MTKVNYIPECNSSASVLDEDRKGNVFANSNFYFRSKHR